MPYLLWSALRRSLSTSVAQRPAGVAMPSANRPASRASPILPPPIIAILVIVLFVRIRRCRSAPLSLLLQSRIRNPPTCPLTVRSSPCRGFFPSPVAPPAFSNHGNRAGNVRPSRQEAELAL